VPEIAARAHVEALDLIIATPWRGRPDFAALDGVAARGRAGSRGWYLFFFLLYVYLSYDYSLMVLFCLLFYFIFVIIVVFAFFCLICF